MTMILDFLFLPMILFIGLVTSYEDLKFGIVRNRWIKLGLFWGIGIILLLFLYNPFAKSLSHFFLSEIVNSSSENKVFSILPSYLFKQLANAGVAILVAFLMWKQKVWAAGDAKLFLVFALLLPLKYYQNSYFALFPSFVLLLNIFIPIFLYFMTRSFLGILTLYFAKIKKGATLKEALFIDKFCSKNFFNKERVVALTKVVSVMLLIFMTIKLVPEEIFQKYLRTDANVFQAAVLILMITFGKKFIEIVSKKVAIIPLVIIFLVVFISNPISKSPQETAIFVFQILSMFLVFMLILSFFNKIIDFYIEEQGTRKIKSKELVSGVFVDEEVIRDLRKDEKLSGNDFDSVYLEGLNQKQVDTVKTWLRKKDQKQVKTYISFPFVAWMFGGVVITFMLQGSLLNFLLPWFF